MHELAFFELGHITEYPRNSSDKQLTPIRIETYSAVAKDGGILRIMAFLVLSFIRAVGCTCIRIERRDVSRS